MPMFISLMKEPGENKLISLIIHTAKLVIRNLMIEKAAELKSLEEKNSIFMLMIPERAI